MSRNCFDPIEFQNQLDKNKGLSGEIAKKDFIIVQNDFRADIKKGDDLTSIPKRFRQNLKTEGVI